MNNQTKTIKNIPSQTEDQTKEITQHRKQLDEINMLEKNFFDVHDNDKDFFRNKKKNLMNCTMEK